MNHRDTGAIVGSTGLLAFLKGHMIRFVLAIGALLFILTIGTVLFIIAIGAFLFGREANVEVDS